MNNLGWRGRRALAAALILCAAGALAVGLWGGVARAQETDDREAPATLLMACLRPAVFATARSLTQFEVIADPAGAKARFIGGRQPSATQDFKVSPELFASSF